MAKTTMNPEVTGLECRRRPRKATVAVVEVRPELRRRLDETPLA